MPRLIDTDVRTAEMVAGVIWVLVTDGIPGLTMRKIAHQSGISTGSLIHHFGDRERMLGIAAHRTGLTLVRAEESDSLLIGLDAFVPVDDEMARLTSAWLGWLELGRSQPWLEATISDLRARERAALSQVHVNRLDEAGLDTVVAILDGLRVAVCAPRSAMPIERARELFSAASVATLERCVSGMTAPDLSTSGGGVVADAGAPGEGGDRQAEHGGEGGEHAEP
jgi:AcrR family transcriptional regulator